MKVLLIDDHALFREGLRFLLRELAPVLELDEAGDCGRALELARSRAYDLVLLDLNLPGLKGMDALRALRQAVPGVPMVVVTGEDSPQAVRAAIDAGAMGFIPKSSTRDVLIQALRLVFAGGVYLPPAVLDAPVSAAPPAETKERMLQLTLRQMDVLRCVIRGLPNKSIARELDISEGTVKAHLSSVMQALGARNRTEAVYAAANLGMRLVYGVVATGRVAGAAALEQYGFRAKRFCSLPCTITCGGCCAATVSSVKPSPSTMLSGITL